MQNNTCALCFKYIVKHHERYLVEGKGSFNILGELKSLPFSVEDSSRFICKQCLYNLKKRKGLTRQLLDIDSAFEKAYNFNERKSSSATKRHGNDSEKYFATPKKQRPEPTMPIKSDAPYDMCSRITSTPVGKFPRNSQLVELPISLVCTKKTRNFSAEKVQQTTQDVDVTIKVKWPSNDAERKLPNDLESLRKMLLRGTYKQIAHAAWKNPYIKSNLTELMLKDVEKEATQLCSRKNPSCLRTTDKQSMLSFSMEKVSDEIKERAPLLHSVLSAASINSRSKATKEPSHFAAIAMAAAVCLKNRSRYMTAVQLLVTIFLYHSNWMVGCVLNLNVFLLSIVN